MCIRDSGYAVGGLAVGESHEEMYHVLDVTVPHLPQNKPTYLMGVGTPANILEAVDRGVDFFDCVYPVSYTHLDVYKRQVEDSVQIYDSIVKTGNEVLDTVLTEKSLFCAANNIKINCIADGRRMDVMDPVDLYTVFGNALDNAIESVKQLENREMRMIDVLVYVRQQFLMINIMNPIGNRVEFEGELPVSTKTKNGYHGLDVYKRQVLQG